MKALIVIIFSVFMVACTNSKVTTPKGNWYLVNKEQFDALEAKKQAKKKKTVSRSANNADTSSNSTANK